MKIRNATFKDLNRIERIYLDARKYMESEGNFQWHQGYPSFKLLKNSILSKDLYVVTDDENAQVLAVFALIGGIDPTYLKIDGKWLNDEPYVTIHRLAKIKEAKGILKVVIEFSLTKANNIRIDTKDTNKTMRKKLLDNGFIECGIILIDNGEERIAYQCVKEE